VHESIVFLFGLRVNRMYIYLLTPTPFCFQNPGNTFGVTFNTGVLFLQPTERTVAFVEKWWVRIRIRSIGIHSG